MRITIAGASSFIGRRLITVAEQEGIYEITAVLRSGNSYRKELEKLPAIKIVECDMNEYEKLGEFTGEGDCFIDLSWNGSRGDARQNSELQRFNYDYNMAAMKSMIAAGYKVVVSAGSQAEYGQCSGVITEETPCNPNTEYGKFKLRIFKELREICGQKGVRFIEPRYFSLYGPDDYEKTLIMSCIYKMLHNIECDLNDCTQLWDYMYIDDAMSALLRLCVSDTAEGVFNFATGNQRMLREFVMDIKTALNSDSEIRFGSPENTFNGMLINLQPAIDKLISAASGWKPTVSFIEGIRLTAAKMQ